MRQAVDSGILLKATGVCSHKRAAAVRNILHGYIVADLEFIILSLEDATFESISDLIAICKDLIETKKPLYLVAPEPEVKEEIEKFHCEHICIVCVTIEEALALSRKKAT